MFQNIMIPVDLPVSEPMARVFELVASMARVNDARLHLVHVAAQPSAGDGITDEDLQLRLESLASEVSVAQHVTVTALPLIAHDPAGEMNAKLTAAIKSVGADLVVVGSHVPILGDYFFTSQGGHLAEGADISVFVVR